jgi:hypothetical protein
LPKEVVETNPLLFAEYKEKGAIEVICLTYAAYYGEYDGRHLLVTSEPIPEKYFGAIKSDIETILNNMG